VSSGVSGSHDGDALSSAEQAFSTPEDSLWAVSERIVPSRVAQIAVRLGTEPPAARLDNARQELDV
jgi:hypothetical protein